MMAECDDTPPAFYCHVVFKDIPTTAGFGFPGVRDMERALDVAGQLADKFASEAGYKLQKLTVYHCEGAGHMRELVHVIEHEE